jgi:hypothetical protein
MSILSDIGTKVGAKIKEITTTLNTKFNSSGGTITGDLTVLGDIVAKNGGSYNAVEVKGDGGSIAMTTNDSGGNANVTFNHRNMVPDKDGSSARIRFDVDYPNGAMYIEMANGVTAGENVTLPTKIRVTETTTTIYNDLEVKGKITSNAKGLVTAWVTFRGADGTIDESYNVSSVVRLSTGTYKVYFETDMVTPYYVPIANSIQSRSSSGDGNDSSDEVIEIGTRDASYVILTSQDIDEGDANYDIPAVSLVVLGGKN